MYIRQVNTKNHKNNSVYTTYRLVESYREGQKVHQRVILSIGSLDLPKRRWPELAALLKSRIYGQESYLDKDREISELANGILKHAEFVNKEKEEKVQPKIEADIKNIDLKTVSTMEHRSLGIEIVANTMWQRLELPRILKECGLNGKQIELARTVILGRLINPGSELSTIEWYKNRTSLIEMTEVELKTAGKDVFYEIGDLLLENKDKIEKKLAEIEQNHLENKRRVYLYDLTNTYFEGAEKENDRAKYGVSKEKRYDCPLVTLALVVDQYGYPAFSQIYEGNQSEPKTLADVLKKLEKDCEGYLGESKPILVMDRGIATKANLELIRDGGYEYTLIKREEAQKEYEATFKELKIFNELKESKDTKECDNKLPDGWTKANEGGDVYIKRVETDNPDICHVLCLSTGREHTERQIDELQEKRFVDDLGRLQKSVQKGSIKTVEKVGERIGRLKSKYTYVARFYDIELVIPEGGKIATDLKCQKKAQRESKRTLEGCYVIETTQIELDAKEIWKQYMLLHHVEHAFRDLKSELGFRPIYHQKESRTDGHLFISVLAYHLLNTIELTLKTKGINKSFKTVKDELSTHQRCTVSMKDEDGKVYLIRVSGVAETVHREIYHALNVTDPLKTKVNYH